MHSLLFAGVFALVCSAMEGMLQLSDQSFKRWKGDWRDKAVGSLHLFFVAQNALAITAATAWMGAAFDDRVEFTLRLLVALVALVSRNSHRRLFACCPLGSWRSSVLRSVHDVVASEATHVLELQKRRSPPCISPRGLDRACDSSVHHYCSRVPVEEQRDRGDDPALDRDGWTVEAARLVLQRVSSCTHNSRQRQRAMLTSMSSFLCENSITHVDPVTRQATPREPHTCCCPWTCCCCCDCGQWVHGLGSMASAGDAGKRERPVADQMQEEGVVLLVRDVEGQA
jgi:hypothetical protein